MELFYKNAKGDTLDLLNNQDKIVLIAAENMHGVELDYTEDDSPYMDGTEVTNVRAAARGITLTFLLVGNVQKSLDYFKSFVKSKQTGYLIEKDGTGREIQIKGIAQVPPYTRMSRGCAVQLSLYCSQPYWEDIEKIITVIANIVDLLYFPEEGRGFPEEGVPFGVIDDDNEKTIENNGDDAAGMEISIVAMGNVSNPRLSCSTGTQNGWYMELDIDLKENDEIIISTVKRNKYITLNGSQYDAAGEPLLDKLTINGNDWLQVEQGENTFNMSASDPALIYFNISYKRRYE